MGSLPPLASTASAPIHTLEGAPLRTASHVDVDVSTAAPLASQAGGAPGNELSRVEMQAFCM